MPYYKTSDPVIVKSFSDYCESMVTRKNAFLELAHSIGADSVQLRTDDISFVGFNFNPDAAPDDRKIWKKLDPKNDGLATLRPKHTFTDMWDKIQAVPKILPTRSYTDTIGFTAGSYVAGGRLIVEECPYSMLWPEKDGTEVLYFKIRDSFNYSKPDSVTEILGSEFLEVKKVSDEYNQDDPGFEPMD